MDGVFFLVILLVVIYALSYYIYKTYFYFPPIQIERLSNKVVIITGASRGIGEELAYEYSRYNCRLVLAARSINILRDKIAGKCRELGARQVECIEFDGSQEESCIQLIKKTVEYYDGIDILILNHTASVYQPYFKSDIKQNIKDMKNLINTNFYGYFLPAMEALPYLAKSGTAQQPSHIIAVSSLAGTCPLPQTTIYGTTKHAIQGFFSNLARELQISETYKNRVTSTVATLGLIATDQALTSTDKSIHFLAVSVRKTAQAILAAGVYGQPSLFYPYLSAIVPPLYYTFTSLFRLAARMGN